MLPRTLTLLAMALASVAYGETTARDPGSKCCAHPTSPHLVCSAGNENMSDVQTCSCQLNLSGNQSLVRSNALELILSNVTTRDFSSCLQSILPSQNGTEEKLYPHSLVLHGSQYQRNVTLNSTINRNWQSPVTTLRLTNMGPSVVDSRLYVRFASVSELVLSNNGIREVKADAFGSHALNGVLHLDLSQNEIVAIQSCSFQHLAHLQSLNLSRNSISEIQPGTFSHLGNLDELDLSYNLLVSVKSAVFAGLELLNNLNLRGNLISQVNFSFPFTCSETRSCKNPFCTHPTPLDNLEFLDLRDNVISDVSMAGAFDLINASLITLRLSGNQIASIGFESFSRICTLQTLDLSRNQIDSIRTGSGASPCIDAASGALNFEQRMLDLNLSGNSLTQIPSGVFSGLTHIAKLDLGKNLISAVSNGAFVGLPALQELSLHENQLEVFASSGLKNLHRLDLRNNNLSQISLAWLESLAPNRDGKLYLGGNSIPCDENLTLLLQRATFDLNLEHEKYNLGAVAQLESLNATLTSSPRAGMILPGPGVCSRQANTECVKYGADMNVCVLQSYMALLQKGGRHDNKENLVRILTQIQNLYHYARNAEGGVNRLQNVKKYVLEAISIISEQIAIPSRWMLGYIDPDIIMGACDVTSRSASDGVITFELSADGEARMKSSKHPNGVKTTIVNACNATTSTTTKRIDIRLPTSVYSDSLIGLQQRIAFATYKDHFLFPSDKEVLSSIISATVAGKNVTNATSPIVVTATFNGTDIGEDNVTCAFWKVATGSWSRDGCERVAYKKLDGGQGMVEVTCRCSHLTNFGIILDYNPRGKPPPSAVKQSISHIGIAASIIGLAITIVYRLSVRELRRGVPQLILLHLCFNLLFVYVFLLPTQSQQLLRNPGGCFVVALILHFVLLSVWGWNVVEAVSMYLLLVRVYNVNMRHFLTKATLATYGSSLFLVMINVIVTYARKKPFLTGYTANGACVVTEPNSIYVILLPISLAFLVNCGMFVKIINSLRSPSKSVASRKESFKLKNRIRQAVCVTALLGITWVFGFLKFAVQFALGQSSFTDVLDLLFTVSNSIQGFVIFLMFCLHRILMESRCWSKWERMRSDSTISSPRWISGTDLQTARKSTNI